MRELGNTPPGGGGGSGRGVGEEGEAVPAPASPSEAATRAGGRRVPARAPQAGRWARREALVSPCRFFFLFFRFPPLSPAFLPSSLPSSSNAIESPWAPYIAPRRRVWRGRERDGGGSRGLTGKKPQGNGRPWRCGVPEQGERRGGDGVTWERGREERRVLAGVLRGVICGQKKGHLPTRPYPEVSLGCCCGEGGC